MASTEMMVVPWLPAHCTGFLLLPIAVLFPEACSRRRSKCAALYNIWTSLAAGKQGSCQAISPKEHALDLINRRWQTGGLKVVPSAVVWTGPARGTIETANHVQEGKMWGKHSLRQKRQCGRWRAAGHERGQGSASYCSLEGGSQPTQREAVLAGWSSTITVHPLTFLPAVPPSKVKG